MSPWREAMRARAAAARHAMGRAFEQSALRVTGMAIAALATAIGSFLLFRSAFSYLAAVEVIGPVLLVRLLSLFFFLLFVMLVASNLLVSFQTLFRSKESDLWMASPLAPERIFDIRSVEIALMSSWAFLFLGGTLVFAYGSGTGAPLLFHALVAPVLLLFAASAHAAGILACIVLVRLFPGLDLKRLVVVVVVMMTPVILLLWRAFRVGEVEASDATAELLVRALDGLGRTQYPMLPGYWAAEALRASTRGDHARLAIFTWTLAITATFGLLLARAAAARWLLPAWQILRGEGLARPIERSSRPLRLAPARGPRRALAWKDLVLFLREPAQWTQAGLVAIIATAYVANLRHLPELTGLHLWGRVAGVLNAGVLLLLVATLATRFGFPLISLEGRRAWVVLLSPLPRKALVTQKWLVAFSLAFPFGLVSALASTRALGVPRDLALITCLVVSAGAFALCGLAVGLGAIFPVLREDNPARIVSGFGGTLAFLLAVGYVMSSTLILGAPRVLHALGRLEPLERLRWDIVSSVGVLVLAAITGGVPLWLGRRHVDRMEW